MNQRNSPLIFLILFIVAIASPFKNAVAADYFNVKDYGAKGDAKTLDNAAINKAIDAANAMGGGTVFFPAGTYLSGSIHLKSNVQLLLGPGSVILGAPQESGAYDKEETISGTQYQDGGHTYFHNSLIWGENLSNVSITGQGMINGGGLVSESTGANKGPLGKASKSIALKACKQVLIRDITIFHGGHFAIIVTGCNLVTIDNVMIDTNRDGIDIDCCSNVVVSNCKVNSPNDDAIVPKSSYAMGKEWTTENLVINNCQVSGFVEGTLLDGTMVPAIKNSVWGQRMGRIKFGTESNGGFRNCTVSNCTFRYCKGLALEEVDGGTLEGFTITNLSMYDINEYAIYITLGERNRDPDSTRISRGKNIIISNIVANSVDSLSGIYISGTPKSSLENIQISNVSFISGGGGAKELAGGTFPELGKGYPELSLFKKATPSYGIFARHVKDLTLDHIRVGYAKEDLRPAIQCEDVQDLSIDYFQLMNPKVGKPAVFHGVSDLRITNSSSLDDNSLTN